MDDLISRQAAIRETWRDPTYSDPLNVMTEMRDRLEALPSAQPEITAEQVKEYCRKRSFVVLTSESFYWLKHDYERGRKDGYTQGFRDAAIQQKAEDSRLNGGGNY